ncbi:MAG TPA: tRNA lysidine(34) synthetase TilS [Blastocatellia bacterium]|nr:tRNA lysidine(34) synthetase TilS [Blastocatellia bacterium]
MKSADAFGKVKRFIDRELMLTGARGVVVAVSGGADSVAMFDMLTRLRAEGAGPELHVAHIDHRMRGRESSRDAEFVRDLAARAGLQVTIDSADVIKEAQARGRGIEETAREIRYDFLLSVARRHGLDRISTGHTMSDQAETFLMRLVRGAGSRGLASMRAVTPAHDFKRTAEASGDAQVLLIRPLLCLTREEVERYCLARGLEYRTDQTNFDARYTRNRVRGEALPALRGLNPRAVEQIARAARIIASDEDALDQMALAFLDEAGTEDPFDRERAAYLADGIASRPAALRRRMIMHAIARARGSRANGKEIGSRHVTEVERLLDRARSGSRVQLPCGLEARREFDRLVFRRGSSEQGRVKELDPQGSPVEACELVISLSREHRAESLPALLESARRGRELTKRDWMVAILDAAALPDRLVVRPRIAGEKALVVGRQSAKKLKSLMIDHKIPTGLRDDWPVVATPDGRYVWSPGLPPAREFAPRTESPRLAKLEARARGRAG